MSERWQAEQVSVVIPTYNRAPVLARVLTALAAQTLPPHRFEVIVVDDGSTDGTPAHLAAVQATCPYRLTRLRQANRGPAAARNAGLAAARGDIVVFVDDDCIPEPALLAEHVASHSVERLAVIGHIAWHPELPVTPFMAFAEPHLFFAYSNITVAFDAPFACYYTGNASVHRASALAVGGFDEDFPHATMEDIDFAYRLRRQGVRFAFNDQACVLHYRTTELLPTLEQMRVRGREAVRLWAKHPELSTFVPIAQAADPVLRRQFYQVVADYYLMLGVQDALADVRALEPGETLPARFQDEVGVWTDARLLSLHIELLDLQRTRQLELAQLAQMRQWVADLEAEHRRLHSAFAEQAVWAADLVRRLNEQPSRGLMSRLYRRLTRLPASLAARRGPRPAPPAPTHHADA